MAVTQQSIDDAEYTFCYDVASVRPHSLPSRGPGGQEIIELPWAFVRFGDLGEERKYVMPTNGVSWVSAAAVQTTRYEFQEYMPFAPFPYELARASRGSGPQAAGDNQPGPVGVHFFGWV